MQEHSNQRRRHSAEFKAEVLRACEQSGSSTAAVALAFGLNANLVRQWQRGRGVRRAGLALPAECAAPGFLPVKIEEPRTAAAATEPQSPESAGIEFELRRGPLGVSVRWPASHAAECARLLSELLR